MAFIAFSGEKLVFMLILVTFAAYCCCALEFIVFMAFGAFNFFVLACKLEFWFFKMVIYCRLPCLKIMAFKTFFASKLVSMLVLMTACTLLIKPKIRTLCPMAFVTLAFDVIMFAFKFVACLFMLKFILLYFNNAEVLSFMICVAFKAIPLCLGMDTLFLFYPLPNFIMAAKTLSIGN